MCSDPIIWTLCVLLFYINSNLCCVFVNRRTQTESCWNTNNHPDDKRGFSLGGSSPSNRLQLPGCSPSFPGCQPALRPGPAGWPRPASGAPPQRREPATPWRRPAECAAPRRSSSCRCIAGEHRWGSDCSSLLSGEKTWEEIKCDLIEPTTNWSRTFRKCLYFLFRVGQTGVLKGISFNEIWNFFLNLFSHIYLYNQYYKDLREHTYIYNTHLFYYSLI